MKNNVIILLALLFLFAGCGGQSFTYQDATETKPGPGLFSGEDGEFNLLKSENTDAMEKGQEKLPEKQENQD